MSPEDLAVLILGIVGVVLQVVFRYLPKLSDWYAAQENKGLLMLAFVIATGGIYFGLSCSPFAADFGIAISCDQPGAFALLKAIFIIASGQSLAYLYTGKKTLQYG